MATLPSTGEVRRAILDHIGSKNVRPGEVFDLTAMSISLQRAGYRAAEINNALEAMGEDGHLEASRSPKFAKVTDAGFAEI